MNKNKAIIGILITVIVILSSIIAFLMFKNSSQMMTSKYGNHDKHHDAYVEVSSANKLLQNGVECKVLMTAQIHNGGNTDNSGVLYGALYTNEKMPRDAFLLKASEKSQLMTTYANPESPTVFDGPKYKFTMFNDIHGFRGVSADTEEPSSRYLFFQGHEFRLVEISSMEGSFMTISRGVCVESI